MTTTCSEFRRRLSVDPHDRDPALLQHRAACELCAAWAAPLARDEERLRRALDVPVPGGLVERILLRLASEPARGWRGAVRRFVPLAASFVLSVATAGWPWRPPPEPDLAADVLAHVDELAYVLESRAVLGLERRGAARLDGRGGHEGSGRG